LSAKDLEPETSVATQLNYDEGNAVGELARKEFPGGVLIEFQPWERKEAAEATTSAISKGATVIFEASFLANGIFVRVDILKKAPHSENWDLIEVKKSTKVKAEHLEDVAIQVLTLGQAGIKTDSCQVMHLNSKCVFPELKNLFKFTDVTDVVKNLLPKMHTRINELQNMVLRGSEPKIEIGSHCDKPHPCLFKTHCWKGFPQPNVFDLPGIGYVRGWDIIKESGKIKVEDLDEDDFDGKTKIAIQSTKKGRRWIEPKPIQDLIAQWKWPLYFLDFETLAPAIPRYPGCSPGSEVPFQFSCHVWELPKHEPYHFEFLHTELSDPRPELVKKLVEAIGDEGSVVAYNMSVERRILLRLANICPLYKEKLNSIAARMVDPLPIFRKHVYDPNFRGSYSIKDITPALVGNHYSYDGLEVSDGMMARSIAEKIIGSFYTKEEVDVLRKSLLLYCRQDTIAMVELTKWMLQLNTHST